MRKISFLLLLVFTSALPSAAAEGPLVQGRILAPGGEPFPGVEIELIPQPLAQRVAERQLDGGGEEKPVARARTGEDGRFEITAPEVGRYTLVVRHRDHLPLVFYLDPLLLPREVPEIELIARQEQSLQVQGDDGRAGLLLAARGWSSYWSTARSKGWWPHSRWATTDEEGRASIAAHEGEEVSIVAVSGDRFIHHQFVFAGARARTPLTLTFEPMSPARVLDAAGRPAKGVHGGFYRPFLAFGEVGQKGEILIPAREGDEVSLRFVDEAIVYRQVRVEEPEEGPPVIHLPAVIDLDGQVVDTESGTTVGGAWVWIPGRQLVRADRSGSFTLRVPFYGKQASFRATAPGYLERRVELGADRLDRPAVTVALQPARTLAGRVVDVEDRPIARAEIQLEIDWRLSPPPRHWRRLTLKTGADGRFEIPKLDRRVAYLLRVERQGYAFEMVSVPAASAGDAADELVIVLEPGLLASGRVLDHAERPVAEAEVALLPMRGGGQPLLGDPLRQKTDAEGRFTFDQGVPGRYLLGAWKEGFSETRVPGVELLEGEVTDLGTVLLDRAATLRGQVVDRDDRPIEGVEVKVRSRDSGSAFRRDRARESPSATTAADGRFQFDGLSRHGRFFLVAQHPDYLSVHLADIAISDESLRVRLVSGVALRGRVVDSAGVAASDVEISLRHDGKGDRVSSDEEGRFTFPALPPGTVFLSARGAAGVAASRRIELSLDPPTEEVRLVLTPAASLRGQLISPDDIPVAEGRITLSPQTGSTRVSMHPLGRQGQAGLSEGDGRFLLTGLEGGKFRLQARHRDYQPIEREIELRPGNETTVTLAFEERREREWTLEGRILGEGGPVEGARVSLTPRAAAVQGMGSAVSLADGRFVMRIPNEGLHNVRVDHPDYATLYGDPVEVGDDSPAELVLQLSRGATVSGQIHGLEPDRLSNLRILARSARSSRAGSVDRNGGYRVTNLGLGRWTVTATLASPSRSVREEVEIDDLGADRVVDLDFGRGFVIEGVVMRNGEPLRQGHLHLACTEGRGFTAGASLLGSGEFRITGVPAGSCRLTVQGPHRRHRLQRQLEVVGDDSVLIEFDTVRVDGQVLRGDDATPVSGAVIRLLDSASRVWGPELRTLSGPDGRFSFLEVPGGSLKMEVSADGFETFEEVLEVAAGGLSQQVLLRPAAEPTVIHVRTVDGRVPNFVNLEIGSADGAKRVEVHHPGSDGKILLTSAAPGTYLLSVSSDPGVAAEIELTVPSAPLRVVLGAGSPEP